MSVAQASRDLDVHKSQLRKWVKQVASDPVQAFSWPGQHEAREAEIERLRREVQKL